VARSRVGLVPDLADQLFDEVFHGHDAGGTAVFVDHERHLGPLDLEAAHRGEDACSIGEHRRVDRDVDNRAIPACQELTEVDDTHRLVEVASGSDRRSGVA
jgi:hypothetical protein